MRIITNYHKAFKDNSKDDDSINDAVHLLSHYRKMYYGYTLIFTSLTFALTIFFILFYVNHDGASLRPLNEIEKKGPPPYDKYAEVARYIVHLSDWGSLATISSHAPIVGFPFNNIFSVSDGPVERGSGVPYFYLSELELSVFDIHKDNRATLTLSEAQSNYCRRLKFDPEDPRCAHVMLTGHMIKINNTTKEASVAKTALFPRHPEMKTWPEGHHWFFAKLNISHIYLLDYFGGAQEISPDDYYKVQPEKSNVN